MKRMTVTFHEDCENMDLGFMQHVIGLIGVCYGHLVLGNTERLIGGLDSVIYGEPGESLVRLTKGSRLIAFVKAAHQGADVTLGFRCRKEKLQVQKRLKHGSLITVSVEVRFICNTNTKITGRHTFSTDQECARFVLRAMQGKLQGL